MPFWTLITPVIWGAVGIMATTGIDVIEIAGAERDRLLILEEGHFAELKAIEVSTKKLGVTVSAFANAAGGDVFVGIGEANYWALRSGLGAGSTTKKQPTVISNRWRPCFRLALNIPTSFCRARGRRVLCCTSQYSARRKSPEPTIRRPLSGEVLKTSK